MKACPEREKERYLDLHNELDGSRREAWRAHLSRCDGCRSELRRLKAIGERVRQDFPEPVLSLGETNAMASAIFGKPAADAPKRRGFGFLGPSFVTGFAAACIIGVSALVFQTHFKADPAIAPPVNLSASSGAASVPSEDAEIIQNLEILKNFNTIEKLVQVVDNGAERKDPTENENAMDGQPDDRKIGNERYVAYS